MLLTIAKTKIVTLQKVINQAKLKLLLELKLLIQFTMNSLYKEGAGLPPGSLACTRPTTYPVIWGAKTAR